MIIAPSSIIMSHTQHVKSPVLMSSSSACRNKKQVESPRIIKRAKIKQQMKSILQSEASDKENIKPKSNTTTLKKPTPWSNYIR